MSNQPTTTSTRDGFGQGLLELGSQNQDVVALCADVTESVRVHHFAQAFPDRYIEVGIAEQNMMGMAAGLAMADKIPFAASYAVFNPGRNWDQLRVSVCYSNLNVKVVGGHAGLTVGPDGATHQALEDIAITRVLPNMTVVVPCDARQAKLATIAIATHQGPCYLRLSREKSPDVTTASDTFELGKAQILREGGDVTIVATGFMVHKALEAAEQLEKDGIMAEVINIHTIKPLDEKAIIASARKTGAVVTVEEHQIAGGLGGAVAEVLSEHLPTPVIRVGARDTFGESGTASELLTKYSLDVPDIIRAVKTCRNHAS